MTRDFIPIMFKKKRMIPGKNLYRVQKILFYSFFFINNSGNPEWLDAGNIVHIEIWQVMKIMNEKWR